MKTQKSQTIQIGNLEIKTAEWGSVHFTNDKNDFWVTPEEIKKELQGDRFYDSLRFACQLLSISTPLELLKAINYEL